MKTNYIIMIALLLITATSCEKLDQEPDNIQNASSLTAFDTQLNAAYYYQIGSVTPMAVMGDFRSDNAYMFEAPFDDFDKFDPNLTSQEDQFFQPFYAALYKSILSANSVIENSSSATEVGEAKFLRALSYFKLVQVFGDVSVYLSPSPTLEDIPSIDLARQPAMLVYNSVIIPDLDDAMNALGAASVDGRASGLAAQALLGKVYMHLGDYGSAEPHLAAVVSGAGGAGVMLNPSFANIFTSDLNSEIIFATQVSSSIVDEYNFATEFWGWYGGLDTKSEDPIDPAGGPTIVAAFDASPGDARRAVTIDTMTMASPKFPQTASSADYDWIEIRLADVMLMYAEALNENGASPSVALGELDDIRLRAQVAVLDPGALNTQGLVREAIANERRLELAFEGQRWFDLVRTNSVDEAMGETVNSNYHVFPIPTSEIFSSFGVITQNPGY